mgnify:CR=1 FL=1
MCGIFFYKSKDDCDKTKLDIYGKRCSHRGPDNTKTHSIYYKNNYMYFMFHRLSINGLNSVSDQPLHKNNNILMCNGEIYNYKSLAKRYNITLESDSDCEIILHLYEIMQIDELCNSLDGVFGSSISGAGLGGSNSIICKKAYQHRIEQALAEGFYPHQKIYIHASSSSSAANTLT